ncbi:peptidoglycan DD-metalloendopeptidase family protein [Gemmiger sp.]
MNPTQTEHENRTEPSTQNVERFSHTAQEKKRSENRRKATKYMHDLNRRNAIGDMLYMVGFWVEYIAVCIGRKVSAVVRGIGDTVLNLLLIVIRPILIGLITLVEDLTGPFVRIASGIRHIHELPDQLEDSGAGEVRAAKARYLASGVRKYFIVLWNAVTYILPAVAAAALVVIVRGGLGLHFVLNVQVNGENVGCVESEQVFENAREDVQSRINTAKRMLQQSGSDAADTDWDVYPTYTLSVSGQTMTESEIANAILRTASDEIINGTAVYVDDQLLYVTTEGDHLRSYLENVKAPFEDAMDSNVYTAFAHNIRLVDGVYLQKSISSYADVISGLTEGGGIHTYTAVEGDTVQSVVDTTGVSFDSLAQMNPELLSLDQEIPEGTVITTGASSAELIKVKVVRRDTETVDIPFDTQNSESDQYDFGKVVTLQDGVDGSEEITYETTMIDGAVTDRQAVAYNVLQAPTPKITVTGTKLKSGMIAKVGSGSFIWPVPNYKYVSRWMGNGHRGADICAAYGTPIIASDSGTIIAAGWHYSYGNYVEIDHGNGYKTLYGHMSSIAVTQGQAVSQGQTIGYVGSTGNSTGNHCHFEMFHNGVLFSAYTLFAGM